MLKDFMEKKQLDFDAPLLSVRRFPAEGENIRRTERYQPKNLIPPIYKSTLKTGPLGIAGTIPFQWEQIPGRPKDGEGSSPKPLERRSLAPKLPPGRVLDVKPPVKSTKDGERINSLKPDRNFESLPSSSNVCSCSGSSPAMPFPAAPLEQKGIKAEEVSDIDDCDVFSDALETLSCSESVFLNFSLSGVSGWDDPDMKPADPQSRKFMMDRFLPAAKAMASDSHHQHNSRKHVGHEPAREMNVIKREDNGPLSYQAGSNFVPKYSPEERDGEEEEEDDDYDDTGNLSSKACGLFPRSLKKSLCLLSPVFRAPGTKVRRQMRLSSAAKKSNLQGKASDHGALVETDKNSWEAVYKHKLVLQDQNKALQEDGSKQRTESTNTHLGNGANQQTYWICSQTPDGSSPYRPSTGGISPYRNEASQSPFHEGVGFLGFPKPDRNCKAEGFSSYSGISSHSSIRSSSLGSPIEKTLYVDSVQMFQSPNSRSDSSGNTDLLLSKEYKDSESQIEVEIHGNSSTMSLQSQLSPPLPKSPSESWLSHTLSGVSTPKPSLRSLLGI